MKLFVAQAVAFLITVFVCALLAKAAGVTIESVFCWMILALLISERIEKEERPQ